jgi:hypothetical protein
MKNTRRLLFSAVAVALLVFSIQIPYAIAHRWQYITSAQARQLKFDHAFHKTTAGLSCDACHPLAAKSTSGRDDLLPRHAQCSDCHSVDKPGDCQVCHLSSSPSLSPRVAQYSPKFSHQQHVSPGKVQCEVCHKDLDSKYESSRMGHFPDMATCMDCHRERLVSNECSQCHEPKDDLVPPDHRNDWMRLHGLASVESEARCATCHNIAEYCQGCHQGDPILNPHPRDYAFRHGQDAHLSDSRCGVCHEDRSFCNECHAAMNILPADHFTAGWLTASGGKHADEAKFDLESCMSCHETPGQPPICARCHGGDR